MARVAERGGSRGAAAPRHRRRRTLLPPGRGAIPPVLPSPPLDEEKYSYAKRHAWVLTVCSLLSFPPLVYSQFRMMQGYGWLWWYLPFVVLGCICFLLPLLTDRLGRPFDLDGHLNLVSSWQPAPVPDRSTCSSRCAGSRSRCCATPGRTWPGCATTTPARSPLTCWTTGPTRT